MPYLHMGRPIDSWMYIVQALAPAVPSQGGCRAGASSREHRWRGARPHAVHASSSCSGQRKCGTAGECNTGPDSHRHWQEAAVWQAAMVEWQTVEKAA